MLLSETKYLGDVVDTCNRAVKGYYANGNIYLSYYNETETGSCSSKTIDDITDNIEELIWTPYADFITRVKQ